jgi:hypothetical protein
VFEQVMPNHSKTEADQEAVQVEIVRRLKCTRKMSDFLVAIRQCGVWDELGH